VGKFGAYIGLKWTLEGDNIKGGYFQAKGGGKEAASLVF
jgi:hypothetical protein